jgi:hypothetical protein
VNLRARESACASNNARVSQDVVLLDTPSDISHARLSHGAVKIIYELWKQFREAGSDTDNNTGHYFLDSC